MELIALTNFSPEKLSVEYRDGITPVQPVIPRHYTLTHSDLTGDLFLTIGNHYAWDKVTSMRDEVLGEWKENSSFLYYCVYVYIDQEPFNQLISAKRYEVFRRELPLALTAIRCGDNLLFQNYPILDQAIIVVNFVSAYPPFARQENWGMFHNYSVK
ncbi:staygreen family protein [Rummeliibacillus stabekisii]|uniref:staygreen family protein n=1 Tax=Rummeliibacillus stabekisii TaxID=241244 RepID=UPI000A601B47